MRLPTIKDVARISGVSVSTVSRVLNKSGYASEDVQARVMETVKRLDYKPNMVARGLKSNTSRTIGLVVTDITNPFFASIAKETEEVLYEKDYNLIICNTSESPEKLALVWRGFFDKILVDAPCSGEGMFRREEDMVKDWTVHGPSYYAPLQRQIACQAVDMLKPGGMLLYSTCTFSRTEDEENIEYILDQYPQMELCALDLSRVPGAVNGIGLDGCMRLFPHRVKGEGHFLALLRKKDGETASPRRTREIPGMLKHQEELMDFLESISVTFDHSRIRIHQDSVYYLPKGLEWNLPLRFLRTGLLLGEVKKGRFEPSQALAMALRAGQFKTTIRLEPEDDRVLRYLKGETLTLTREEGPLKGWCLVSMGDHPMGWAKGTGMSLKNKYYPGWRWQ